jgi:predicted PurR-regulated permease PerM
MQLQRQVLFWIGLAAALLLAIGLLKDILLPFVVGIVVAYFLNPLVDRIERLGLGRMFATALVVVGSGLIVAAAMVVLLPLAATQIRQLADTLPNDLDRFRTVVESWAMQQLGGRFPSVIAAIQRASNDLADSWSGALMGLLGTLWSRGLAFVNFLSLILITPVVIFYLLVDWHRMLQKLDAWLPRDHAPTIRRLAADVNDSVSAFIRGQGTICIVLGIYYAIALTLIGLPYGFLIGLATGFFAFVPFAGWATGFMIAIAIALGHAWPDLTLLFKVLAVYGVGAALDSAFLSPKIVGEKVGLHPVWLIFALFAFSYLFGFVGVLVAVPLAAAFGVIIRFAIDVYLTSSVYRGAVVASPDRAEAGASPQ